MSIQAIKAIDGIRFSVWSPTEIRKYSVAEITAPETYDCLLYTSPSPRDRG